jgi:hypothetical protein
LAFSIKYNFLQGLKSIWEKFKIGILLKNNSQLPYKNSEKVTKLIQEMVLFMDQKLILNSSILLAENINAEHANWISNFLKDLTCNIEASK